MPGLPVTLLATGMLNDVIQPDLTTASGQTSGTWTTTRAEMKSITAMLPDGSALGPRNVTFMAGPASTLVFKTQPPDVEAGEPMGVEVAFQDADGNLASSIMPVAIRLGANPPAAELHGALQSSPSAGVASFSGVHVDVAESDYSLIASAMGLPNVESAPFDVAAGAPDAATSSITASPHSNDADGVSAAAIAISVRNQYDLPIAGLGLALRVGLGSGTGTFSFGPNIPNVYNGEELVLAKIDGDAHLDLILLHGGDFTRGLNFSLGNGAGSFGTFNTTVPKISTTSDPRGLAVVDLGKDGDLDLVVAEREELTTYTNNGNGSFVAKSYAIPDLAFLDGLNAVAVGDFDGDPWLDVAVGHSSARIHVFRGIAGGAFDPHEHRPHGHARYRR